MENNYFDTIEKISGRLDKLCKKGILSTYRASTSSRGYSLIIENKHGKTVGYDVTVEGTGFKPILEELKRLEKLKR